MALLVGREIDTRRTHRLSIDPHNLENIKKCPRIQSVKEAQNLYEFPDYIYPQVPV